MTVPNHDLDKLNAFGVHATLATLSLARKQENFAASWMETGSS